MSWNWQIKKILIKKFAADGITWYLQVPTELQRLIANMLNDLISTSIFH